jgi:hypothetical protein
VESSGSPRTGEEKNKQWSESVFGVTPYRAEPGTSDMCHGWIIYYREVELHITFVSSIFSNFKI